MSPRGAVRASNREERTRELVDEQLIEAYLNAADRFGSHDLVLVLNVEKEDLLTYPRGDFQREWGKFPHADAEQRDFVLDRVGKAATQAKSSMTGPLGFWLVAIFDDGIVCTAVRCSPMGEGSRALS